MKEIMCLILARGGSKRIPQKNIKKLAGKPLIAYTIDCAKKSKYINRIVVSTDDKEIAKVAKKYGADVPFFRPDEISKDDSTELDAFKHALGWLRENEGYEPDLIVKLFPTAPFRSTRAVDEAIELLRNNPDADSVRSVKLCSEHPHKMWQIEDLRLKSLIPIQQKQKEAHTLSYQILPEVYIQNAAIDVTKPNNVWEKESITGTNIVPFVMDEIESLDINNPIDFEIAEMLIKKQGK